MNLYMKKEEMFVAIIEPFIKEYKFKRDIVCIFYISRSYADRK